LNFSAFSDAKEPDNAGFVTFGGPDTKNCKSFRNFPAEDYDTWRTWVTQVRILQTLQQFISFQVSFNSKDSKGTYLTRFELHNKTLVLPKATYSQITSYFGGQTSNIACSSYKNIPDITLNVYGRDYTYPLSRQFKPMSGNSYYCRIDIDSSDDSDEDQIILNRYIFDKYCVLFDFDNALIGMADLTSK
jgi:hypothetical protein